MRLSTRTLALLAALPLTAAAQSDARTSSPTEADATAPRRWEARITTGTLMPTGALNDVLRSAPITAAQLAWAPRPGLALTGTLGWARSRDRLTPTLTKVDAFTADLGAEWRGRVRDLGANSTVSAFVGSGLGGRRYDSRAAGLDASHHFSTYAAVGGELVIRRVGIRVEVRDYVGGFRAAAGGSARVIGNDVVVMSALRLVPRRAAAR